MTNPGDRLAALYDALATRILVLDGAMGTMLQQRNLTAPDFGGPALEGCNENLVKTRPDVVLDIHREYFKAGADIVETNTFGGTRVVLAEYHLQDQAHELNYAAAQLARQAADECSTPARPRWVLGSMGPTTKAITVTGGITFRQLEENYYEQAKALVEGGADILVLETCQDTRNVKAGLLGIQRVMRELGRKIPVMVSGTIEPMGTMLAGQSADAFLSSISHVDLLSVGLNCATGPEFMTDHIRTLSEMASTRISCYPNAGLPNEDGKYLETPQSLAEQLDRFANHGWLNLVGGCCGTTAAHIHAIAQMAEGKRPREPKVPAHRAYYSSIELVEAGLGAVIEKDGIDHLARSWRQAKRDVGDSEHGLDVRNFLLDQAQRLDGFDRPADIVDIACGAGKDQRIDDNIFGRNAVLLRKQLDRTPGYREFALPSECLGLLLVFVDRANNQRSAVSSRVGTDALEFLFPVLEVNRVNEAFALAVAQRQLDADGIGGVDHDGRLHQPN